MRKSVSITGEEAAVMITGNATVATIDMTLVSTAEATLKAIEQRFLEIGSPRGLTLVHSCGQSDRDRGIQHFAHEAMLSRIIEDRWGLQPRMMQLIADNKILAYYIPQGQFTQLYRSTTGDEPGRITKVGLGTLVGPGIDGGKMNEITMNTPSTNEMTTIGGGEYMRYKPIPLDRCVIRGTYVDKYGNLTMDEEAMQLEVFSVVMACKKFGGKVLAQVKYKIRAGSLHYKRMIVPGVFIDAVVTCLSPEEDHRQTHSFYMNPTCYGGTKAPVSFDDVLPISLYKVIGRRTLMELAPGDVLGVRTGIPNDVVGPITTKEGMSEDVIIAVEFGIYGGIPMGGIGFGIIRNQFAPIRHDGQFDYYNGPGVGVTHMSADEVGTEGSISATRLGPKPMGTGGSIDIATNAKHVVFYSSLIAKGLGYSFEGGRLHINQEGSLIKFASWIKQTPYNGRTTRKKNRKMHYVAGRAVLELRPEGLTLTKIAPGVDIQTRVLDLMEFTPLIGPDLKEMDIAIPMEDASLRPRKYILSN